MPSTEAFNDMLRRQRFEREKELKRTLLAEEAARHSQGATIEWLADYERRADARSKAWKDSIFSAAFDRLFAFRATSYQSTV